ncbi:hypothetical protein LTR56_020503 [Elasticomyces elasticus]|nr:hypothetical protein LTR22_024291 [Elasticomyces elasticus]KAK3625242.1 hypothetical protein LTR56_020503 [Elasticomyces elasticus]KAK4906185.1 hypothetical protein LTR49_024628 [Elasticomyces elasticus]KAK5744084.1 hypothetical protein LTS12_023618 [Elasticomyces elasticus]
MADREALLAIISKLTPASWPADCATQLASSPDYTGDGLVDGQGQSLPSLTKDAWGVTIGVCYRYCDFDRIPFTKNFDFQNFSASFTNYFLPWIALTAQLPYETGNPWSNAMSFCLAVGSPALITFSLTLTILNRFWVRTTFNELHTVAQGNTISSHYSEIAGRVRAMQYLLQEAQQVPLRLSQADGWLSSLIVCPDNTAWWKDLQGRLESTRRGVTASLVAQMTVAGLAYLFTVISSFNASLGDPATALQIASGSMWIWLIPVILGWITVGTQSTHHAITDALSAKRAHRALEFPTPQAQAQLANSSLDYTARQEQCGLVVRSGLTPQLHSNQPRPGAFEAPPHAQLEVPTWMGASVQGDEAALGPIYNYARPFTWWRNAFLFDRTLFQVLDNIKHSRDCQTIHLPTGAHQAWDDNHGSRNLAGDSQSTALYCGLDARAIRAYPTWSELPAEVYKRLFAASVAGLCVQWGTTGASIVIAYKTPTVGFGCRSASYTFYGGLGTAVWLFMMVSMLLSHAVMLRYQDVHERQPTVDFRIKNDPSNPDQYTRSLGHSILCALAVTTRYIGKSLAIINTNLLVLTSIFQFIGLFDNCWCQGNAFGMGADGWVVLFKDAHDLADAAASSWGGGLAMTLTVCVMAYIFFALGSLKR